MSNAPVFTSAPANSASLVPAKKIARLPQDFGLNDFARSNSPRQQAQSRRTPVAAMNTHQPVSSAIQSVKFDFLSTNDVRTLSVKRITNPTTFDTLLHPVSGGLHDAALGAFLDNP
jgi:hypothetical protein